MITINLNPEQAETLKETLVSYLSDLRMEIADTDKLEFRQMLKKRKAIFESIVGQLDGE